MRKPAFILAALTVPAAIISPSSVAAAEITLPVAPQQPLPTAEKMITAQEKITWDASLLKNAHQTVNSDIPPAPLTTRNAAKAGKKISETFGFDVTRLYTPLETKTYTQPEGYTVHWYPKHTTLTPQCLPARIEQIHTGKTHAKKYTTTKLLPAERAIGNVTLTKNRDRLWIGSIKPTIETPAAERTGDYITRKPAFVAIHIPNSHTITKMFGCGTITPRQAEKTSKVVTEETLTVVKETRRIMSNRPAEAYSWYISYLLNTATEFVNTHPEYSETFSYLLPVTKKKLASFQTTYQLANSELDITYDGKRCVQFTPTKNRDVQTTRIVFRIQKENPNEGKLAVPAAKLEHGKC